MNLIYTYSNINLPDNNSKSLRITIVGVVYQTNRIPFTTRTIARSTLVI